MQRLNAGALGLALGIIWGVGILAVVVANRITGSYGANWIVTLASLYPGLSLTPVGAVIGFLWGFVDGVICGVLVGWIYNGLLPRPAPASATPPAP